jgi:hypothetical protein
LKQRHRVALVDPEPALLTQPSRIFVMLMLITNEAGRGLCPSRSGQAPCIRVLREDTPAGNTEAGNTDPRSQPMQVAVTVKAGRGLCPSRPSHGATHAAIRSRHGSDAGQATGPDSEVPSERPSQPTRIRVAGFGVAGLSSHTRRMHGRRPGLKRRAPSEWRPLSRAQRAAVTRADGAVGALPCCRVLQQGWRPA